MPKQKRTQPRPKTLYRVKDCGPITIKPLVQRGSITFWMSDDFEKTWMYTGEKQRGSQFDYTDQAILVMLTVKEVFHLTNRGVEGFVRSLFRMMKMLFVLFLSVFFPNSDKPKPKRNNVDLHKTCQREYDKN